MSKTVIIFGGLGRMGRPTAYFLKQMGYDIIIVDRPLETGMAEFDKIAHNFKVLPSTGHNTNAYYLEIYAPHLVVSTLPYTENISLAERCIQADIAYIDLGGKVENTEQIKGLAEKKNIAVFTDLGLAPGLINIMTEALIKQYNPDKDCGILAAVGGIPIYESDIPFSYHCTWNIDGLINEYFDEAEILYDGAIEKCLGMSMLEKVEFKELNREFECFITSGASSHSIKKLQELGYLDFCYKTLRYPGHRDFILGLTGYVSPTYPSLSEIKNTKSFITRLSETAPIKDDLVIGLVRFYQHNIQEEFVIRRQAGWTAMQRATAGPLAVAGHMILEGYLPQKYLTYTDIVPHWFYFKTKLKELGIEL